MNILKRAHAETENNQKYYNNFDFKWSSNTYIKVDINQCKLCASLQSKFDRKPATAGVIEEETDRREGKGRRCGLRDSFNSVPHYRFSTTRIN